MKEEKIKKIDTEDFIWAVFLVLFLLKIHSNQVEREYRINNDESCRKRYHYINEFTLIAALLIYLYFIFCNCKEEKINGLALLGNILSVVTLVIFIYLELLDDD